MKNCSIAEKAEYIANKLIEKGVIIHRYDAYSTNSIYLKLDVIASALVITMAKSIYLIDTT